MKLKRVLASALLLATLLTLPAWAAQASGAKGEANITPDTPMAKIRSNPSVMGAGLYTYNQEQDNPRDIRKWKDTTLREYVNDCTAEDCAKGLNRMIENYNSGIQITYKLYTDEEIAAVPTRQKAEIYYFPGSDPGGKFVLVIGGNAIPGITGFTRAGLARGGHPAVNRLIEDRNHRGQVVGSVAYVHAVDSPAGLDQSLGRPVEQRTVAVVAGAGHQQYAAVLLTGLDDILLPRGDADFDGRFHRAPSFHGCVLRVP